MVWVQRSPRLGHSRALSPGGEAGPRCGHPAGRGAHPHLTASSTAPPTHRARKGLSAALQPSIGLKKKKKSAGAAPGPLSLTCVWLCSARSDTVTARPRRVIAPCPLPRWRRRRQAACGGRAGGCGGAARVRGRRGGACVRARARAPARARVPAPARARGERVRAWGAGEGEVKGSAAGPPPPPHAAGPAGAVRPAGCQRAPCTAPRCSPRVQDSSPQRMFPLHQVNLRLG